MHLFIPPEHSYFVINRDGRVLCRAAMRRSYDRNLNKRKVEVFFLPASFPFRFLFFFLEQEQEIKAFSFLTFCAEAKKCAVASYLML